MIQNILKTIRHLEITTNNKIDSLFSGNYRSAFKGRGIEFADIRPYETGDDMRDIDWKTTSKHGKLFVKTYHDTRDNTLFFIIDGGAGMQFSSQKQKKYERLLKTFALLAFSAIKNGDRIGILFYKNGEEKIFPPKKGRRNILQILQFCIQKYTSSQQQNEIIEKPNMAKVLKKISFLLPHSSDIFWLTGELEDLSASVQKRITMIHIKHSFVPIVFLDPIEENCTQTGNFSFQDSFSGKISFLTITPEIQKKFQNIRLQKKKRFQHFFQHIKSPPLFFHTENDIFKGLLFFFQRKTRKI